MIQGGRTITGATMKCPDCRAGLKEVDYRGILIHECGKCKGRWFEPDELRKAKDKTDDDLRWLDFFPFDEAANDFTVSSQGKRCPRCAVEMTSLRYATSRVVIDKCTQCKGVWLDHGEFEKIVRYLEHIVDTESAAGYAKDAFRQFLQIATGSKGPVAETRDFLAVLKLLEFRIAVEHPGFVVALQRIYQASPFK